jgi:hypothetical protein
MKNGETTKAKRPTAQADGWLLDIGDDRLVTDYRRLTD